jgi:hypothetical protein
MRISILQGSATGTAVYVETQTPTTNANGLATIEIGGGTPVTGTFSAINWASGIYFIKTETDPIGGTSYTITGTSQILSVPYALYSKTAADAVKLTGNQTIAGNKTFTGTTTVPTPVSDNDAANKSYVDDISVKHTIGESYGGGTVFYVYDDGKHGLIAATADLSSVLQWYNGTYRYTGTTGDGVGAGAINTAMIVATQINDNQTGNFDAKICADYSVTVDGVTYGDWYLPSKFELNLLYLQKSVVGGFYDTGGYWSSTEYDDGNAWYQWFFNGSQDYSNKDNKHWVRAIRSF